MEVQIQRLRGLLWGTLKNLLRCLAARKLVCTSVSRSEILSWGAGTKGHKSGAACAPSLCWDASYCDICSKRLNELYENELKTWDKFDTKNKIVGADNCWSDRWDLRGRAQGGVGSGFRQGCLGMQRHARTPGIPFFFLCRMFTSYHRQFSTWQTLRLSSAWKSAEAIKEVAMETSLRCLAVVCFCLTLS